MIAPLFAADPIVYVGVVILICALVFVGFIWLLMKQYRRCPGNRLLVIYGRIGGGRQPQKVVHGGAAFVWPLLQDYDYISLDPLHIEVPLRGALSIENIRVNVPSVFTVAVSTDEHVMHNAAVRLLGLPRQEIERLVSEIIFGQLRQVIVSMSLEEINRDRDRFLSQITQSLGPELSKVGLQLINVNITDITDESGYIDAIGQKAALDAIREARGDEAKALLRKFLADFDVSIPELVAQLLDEGKLSENDCEEIRRLLDASSSSS